MIICSNKAAYKYNYEHDRLIYEIKLFANDGYIYLVY